MCGDKVSFLTGLNLNLSDRYFSVRIGNLTSSAALLNSGLPPGLCSGTITLLSLHASLGFNSIDLSTSMRMTLRFICLKRNDSLFSAIQPLLACLDEVKLWLASNFLSLNESKAEVIVFISSDKSEVNNIDLWNLSVFNSQWVQNFGVFLDSRLTLNTIPLLLPLVFFSLAYYLKLNTLCLKKRVIHSHSLSSTLVISLI